MPLVGFVLPVTFVNSFNDKSNNVKELIDLTILKDINLTLLILASSGSLHRAPTQNSVSSSQICVKCKYLSLSKWCKS